MFIKKIQQQKCKEAKSSNEQKNEPELENVIKIVVELLESVMIYLKDELASENGDSTNKLDGRTQGLIASSIRLLMCWLSHESLLEKEILDLMPRFVRYAERLIHSEQPVDLFAFLAAGLQKIFLNLQAKRDLKNAKKLTSTADLRNEYELAEIGQEMDRVKTILDTCYEHMKHACK